MNPRNRGTWMWEEAFEMLEQADRLHRHFFHLSARRAQGPSWEPPLDMLETPQRIVIVVALPGVAPADLRIVIDNGVVSVEGERPLPMLPDAALRRLEIPYGRFLRRIELPPGRYDIEQRELEHGCLRLILRKL